jgi:hypothetical protein
VVAHPAVLASDSDCRRNFYVPQPAGRPSVVEQRNKSGVRCVRG